MVTLNSGQLNRVAQQAWYVISVSPNVTDTSCLGLSGYYGTEAVYSGEGSKSIAYLQKLALNWPKATFQLDVPVMPVMAPVQKLTLASTDSFVEQSGECPGLQAGANWTRVTADDIEALRQTFIVKWGDVWKPNVYGVGTL